MGEGLEKYIQNAFADTQAVADEKVRMEMLGSIFSYQGNKNNPPDLMLQNGDAIEIKKLCYSTQ
jgi:hypothetical protein